MKNARKLIPALAMLLVSAVMMSTASFAWFTMNSTVTADSISISAVAPASLWIKQDTDPDTAWATTMTLANENSTWTGAYEPVRPKAGTALAFETVKDPTSVPITGIVPDGTEMKDSNSYYMDTFDLKLDGQKDAESLVKVQGAIFFAAGTADSADKIWESIRVAFVVDGVVTDVIEFETLNANGGTAYTDFINLATIKAAAEDPTEVKVYAWFDGEDDACKNENAFNKHTFSISLVFQLDNTDLT